MITLKEVDETTLEACASLTCKPEQRQFTNSPVWSLLETAYTPLKNHSKLYAVCSDTAVVGMVRLDYTLHPDCYEFTNLLIDEKYQRRHYAAEAVAVILELFRKERRHDTVRIFAAPENAAALELYRKAGFLDLGKTKDGVFRILEYKL
jgi:diamine N-acetyltransferase